MPHTWPCSSEHTAALPAHSELQKPGSVPPAVPPTCLLDPRAYSHHLLRMAITDTSPVTWVDHWEDHITVPLLGFQPFQLLLLVALPALVLLLLVCVLQ